MDKKLSRRIDKIEEKLEPEKGCSLRFPDGKGGFIELPGRRSIIDILAIVGASKNKLDETGRN
jgi:hypothetical protein